MLKVIVQTSLLCLSLPVFALVPPDYQEPPSDFTAEIEAGLQLNTGNTESSSFNGRSKLIYDTQQTTQEATFKAYFASEKSQITSEKYELQLQSNYKLNKGYIFGRGDFTWDQFGSYTQISTLSSGYGFNAINNYKTKLSLEVGPGYRYNLPNESVDIPNPDAEKDIILRTAAKFSQKLQEYSSLNADLTAEVGENNNTLTLDMNYKNLVFQDWAFKIGMNIKYTEVVPDDSQQTDTITTFNLLYTFR
jgi:putative salt-induced outer membrane protein